MTDGSFVVPADRLADPYLFVTPEGAILFANPAAADEFGVAQGQGLQGQRLGDHVGDAPDRLEPYLRMCATSSEPMPGSLTLKDGRAFRVDGFLLFRAAAGDPATICLRLRAKEASNASFVALNDKIDELSHEIRIRLATEAQLRKALAERDSLIRELHHRIRNTLQVIASLAAIEARDGGENARRLIEHGNRVKAVGLIYHHHYGKDLLKVSIGGFLAALVGELAGEGDGVRLLVKDEAGDLELALETAVPFALLVHDLAAIGIERAWQGGSGASLSLRLYRPRAEVLEFEVRNSAAGPARQTPERAPEHAVRNTLIKRLARQINATLVMNDDYVSLSLPCVVGSDPDAVR